MKNMSNSKSYVVFTTQHISEKVSLLGKQCGYRHDSQVATLGVT